MRNESKVIRVFILAGQSNMEGQAVADLDGKDYNEGRGTLKTLLKDPSKRPWLEHLQDEQGEWTVRDDVWVRYQRESQPQLLGPLSVGYAVYGGRHHFGPELEFGHVIGNAIDDPVLLIRPPGVERVFMKTFVRRHPVAKLESTIS